MKMNISTILLLFLTSLFASCNQIELQNNLMTETISIEIGSEVNVSSKVFTLQSDSLENRNVSASLTTLTSIPTGCLKQI